MINKNSNPEQLDWIKSNLTDLDKRTHIPNPKQDKSLE